MKKIISLFQRNYDGDRLVRDEVVPGAEWVLNGEGVATKKYDGTCCMVKDGVFYKRREVGPHKAPPEGFLPEGEADSITGKQMGWVKVTEADEDKWHRAAWQEGLKDGTYELLGPNVQGNPEGAIGPMLWNHADSEQYPDFPRTFEDIKAKLVELDVEGVVWHHPDGRMVKIKKKDFGLKRNPHAVSLGQIKKGM